MNVVETTNSGTTGGGETAGALRHVVVVISLLHEPRVSGLTPPEDRGPAAEPLGSLFGTEAGAGSGAGSDSGIVASAGAGEGAVAGAGAAGVEDSTTRLFRGKPVLAWTLERLSRSRRVEAVVVVCREDQFDRALPIAERRGAYVLPASGEEYDGAAVEAVAAARRWADGWRGGLLQTCEFDRGFCAPLVAEAARQLECDALLLIDPAAGLLDAALVDALVAHAEGEPGPELIFSPAAPGLSGVLLRPALLARLTAPGLRGVHPGKFLHYLPDDPIRDPIAGESCAPVAAPLARTAHRFSLDSRRQVERVARATQSLNGRLATTEAAGLLGVMDALVSREGGHAGDPVPREVVLELTTRRATKPIFSPTRHLPIGRPDLGVRQAERLFAELAAYDDIRLILSGAGDPLLSGEFPEIVRAARDAGIRAVRVETDLLGVTAARVEALADAPVDVVSVHLPAATEKTYARVMGADGLASVIENIRTFLRRRESRRSGVPILAPLFTKCHANLAEMEPWYDHWLRVLGAAVIVGPGDYAGQIPDAAVADMTPPRRRACARLGHRLTVLSDGRYVACEQDVLGKRPLGEVGRTPLREVWARGMAALRADHSAGRWDAGPLCAKCREWHRP